MVAVNLRWDPYPFILLNLAFSTQAAYAAPLILLAQNRQADRDRVQAEEDRARAASTRADTEYLARELASLRVAVGELATRDFIRGELGRLVGDDGEEREEKARKKKEGPRGGRRRRRRRGLTALSVPGGRLPAMRAHAVVPSPVGPLTVVASDGVLVRLYLEPPGPDADLGPHDEAALAPVAAQLGEYFRGDREAFDSRSGRPAAPSSWRCGTQLTRIPYGETRSYGQVARAVGEPGGAQAVGLACGRNPLAVVVPCHRVVGADGSLVGFGGGLPRKRFLLDLEQRDTRLF